MTIIIPANSAADTAFSVDNSCRWNDGDSPEMEKTMGSGDRQKWTISMWIKRCNSGTACNLWKSWNSADNEVNFRIDSNDFISVYDEVAGSTGMNIVTSRKFRDPAAWYHIVFAVDTTQGTAANRINLYINGTKETAFSTETYPSQNYNMNINQTDETFYLGVAQNSTSFFDGYFAEVVFIDGTQYAASDFGEFDEDSPTIWKPKDVSGLTFGTNGFYLDFEASDNLGNDANGGTDLTEVNLAAADQATDTPTNNFCTMNPLGGQTAATSNNSWSLAEGNMSFVSGNAYSQWITGTMSISAGKWYWELQPQGTFGTSDNVPYVGIIKTTEIGARQALTSTTSASNDTITMEANGDKVVLGTTSAGYGDTFTNDDKLMMAVDCDNGKVWWGVNGTWQKSGAVGDPANGTNANATFTAGTEFVPYCLGWSGDATPINYNFGGCPAFTVSSAAQDENGYGRFEFSPPDSFLSLCSKNLGSDGG